MISISSHSRFSERLNRIYLISYQVIVILQMYFLTWYRFWGGVLELRKIKRKWRVVQYHYCWVAWCVPPFSIYSFPALFRYVIGRSSWTRSRSVKHFESMRWREKGPRIIHNPFCSHDTLGKQSVRVCLWWQSFLSEDTLIRSLL